MMNDGLASDDQVKTCIMVRFRANFYTYTQHKLLSILDYVVRITDKS